MTISTGFTLISLCLRSSASSRNQTLLARELSSEMAGEWPSWAVQALLLMDKVLLWVFPGYPGRRLAATRQCADNHTATTNLVRIRI